MESLIAALVGWIDTEGELINIQTGLRVQDVTEPGGEVKVLITTPIGEQWEYSGKDADRILDRAETLAVAAGALIQQLNALAATAQPPDEVPV